MQPLTKTINGVEKPLYVLRRISGGFVFNSRALSNTAEGLPNPGPDQEYLPIMTEVPPDFDGRLNIRTQTEGPNELATPKQWEIKYTVTPRTKAEKKEVVRNIKRSKVADHLPTQDQIETIVFLLAVILRDARGLSLTPREQALKDKLMVIVQKIKANDDHLKDLEAAIDADQTPDLDTGWEAPTV